MLLAKSLLKKCIHILLNIQTFYSPGGSARESLTRTIPQKHHFDSSVVILLSGLGIGGNFRVLQRLAMISLPSSSRSRYRAKNISIEGSKKVTLLWRWVILTIQKWILASLSYAVEETMARFDWYIHAS